ncbi:MAG TPA: RnfABCDGE type electron transport complex subunit D, partial [Desulfosarcina sp.]|nr:RnfABCDGE type electron transport complex subunit D [Desulfosarcina sp.]
MNSKKTLIVSHAPFWHDGSGIPERSYHTIIAALPAAIAGIAYYGAPALGVICLAMSSAILWEVLLNYAGKRPISVGNGNAALIGLLTAMVLPASVPWWIVVLGTFLAIVVGMQIFGGIGANPFNPVALAIAILMVSYKTHMDFDAGLVNFSLNFPSTTDPLAALKAFGPAAVDHIEAVDLIMGRQVGGLGSTCGLALIIGGIYLILRGIIRWEISVAFVAGVFVCAMLFNLADP